MLIALLSTLFMAPAQAACTSCDTSWTLSQTLTLFGTNYTGREKLGGVSDDIEALRGIDELHQQRWKFSHSQWVSLRNKVETEVGSIPGNILWLAIYTSHDDPSTTVAEADMKAMTIVAKNNGVFTQYTYKNSGGTWTGQSSFQDQLSGDFACDQVFMMQELYVGTEQDSTIYVLEKLSSTKFATIQGNHDPDVLFDMWTTGSTASSIQAASIFWDPAEIDGVIPGDEPTDACRQMFQCSDQPDPGGKFCQAASTVGCHDGGGLWPSCPMRRFHESPHTSYSTSDFDTAYAFRDALVADPSLAKWVGYYYLYAHYAPTDQVQADASDAALAAVKTIIDGKSTDVVITTAIKNDVTTAMGKLDDISPLLDTVMDELETVLDDREGETRSQFCTAMTGASDCGLN